MNRFRVKVFLSEKRHFPIVSKHWKNVEEASCLWSGWLDMFILRKKESGKMPQAGWVLYSAVENHSVDHDSVEKKSLLNGFLGWKMVLRIVPLP